MITETNNAYILWETPIWNVREMNAHVCEAIDQKRVPPLRILQIENQETSPRKSQSL